MEPGRGVAARAGELPAHGGGKAAAPAATAPAPARPAPAAAVPPDLLPPPPPENSVGEPESSAAAWAEAAAAAVAAVPSAPPQLAGAGSDAPPTGSLPLPSLASLRSLSRSLSSGRRMPEVWGGLQPAPGTKLPAVLLQGRSVVLGRGRDAFNDRLPQLLLSRTSSLAAAVNAISGSGSSGGIAEAPPPSGPAAGGSRDGRGGGGGGAGAVTFVEVADGRVSRLHASVKYNAARQQAMLEDLSSNGTFLNGARLGPGQVAPLADGDRISLVLSVAPLAEQAFIFRSGDPRGQEGEAAAEWRALEASHRLWQPPGGSPGAAASPKTGQDGVPDGLLPPGQPGSPSARRPSGGLPGGAAASRHLARCQTSQYTTPHTITLDDLQCQICLCTLRDCVALDPCGHNFCAPCLSHHLAALLGGGLPLACPLRCAPPERVVINTAVRQLLAGGGRQFVEAQIRQQAQQAQQQPPAGLEPLLEGCASSAGSASSGQHLNSRQGSQPAALAGRQASLPAPAWSDSRSASAGEPPALSPTSATASAEVAAAVAAAAAAAAAAASAERRALDGASASASSSAPPLHASIPEYRRVDLQQGSPSSGSAFSSPPPSPFESLSGRGRFDSFRSGDLSAAMADVEGMVALPGAPTLPAAHPIGSPRASLPAGGGGGVTALPGAPTLPAARLPSLSEQAPVSAAAQQLAAASSTASSPAAAPSAASAAVAAAAAATKHAPPAAAEPAAAAAEGEAAAEEGEEEEAPMPMHPACPLTDDVLPLETASLKQRQLGHSLGLLERAEDEVAAMAQLEALARLAWSDEAARGQLGAAGGVELVVLCMQQHLESEGVQCGGCLALLALVRGEGEASLTNRRRLAEGGGVGVIADGMFVHIDAPMVQLSALLCLVPLALENTRLQAAVARACMPTILAAIRLHANEPEVVGKALIVLGVLGQGEEEEHETIRDTLIEATPFPLVVARVLRELGTTNEDVLWSALFALAVIARDSSARYVQHLLALARAGVLPALEAALAAYRASVSEQGTEPDEMILRAGDFLLSVLRAARNLLWLRFARRLARGALLGLAAVAAVRLLRRRAGHPPYTIWEVFWYFYLPGMEEWQLNETALVALISQNVPAPAGFFGVPPLITVFYDRRASPPPPAAPPLRRLQALDLGGAALDLGGAALDGGAPDAAGSRRSLLQAVSPYLFGRTCLSYAQPVGSVGYLIGASVPFRHQWAEAEAAARAYATSLVQAGTPTWLSGPYPASCLYRVELVQYPCTWP